MEPSGAGEGEDGKMPHGLSRVQYWRNLAGQRASHARRLGGASTECLRVLSPSLSSADAG